MWYWHRIIITITPQAERQIWESAASAPGALSHTYTSLQTHPSPFDIANCRLMGAANACGNAASCMCVCWHTNVSPPERTDQHWDGRSINILTHCSDVQICLNITPVLLLCVYVCVCACVCVCERYWRIEWWDAFGLLRDEVTCQGERERERERETAVLMWCDISCLSVTLCSLVAASGAQLNAVYQHHQTQC